MALKIRPFEHLSGAKKKEFIHAVSTLKTAGLIPQRIDPRTAFHGQLVGGKTLRDIVSGRAGSEYTDVIEGRAAVIPKSKITDTLGYKVVKRGIGTEKVVIPTQPQESVKVKGGNIVIKHTGKTGNITRTLLPRKNLKQYLLDAKSLPEIKGNQRYAFMYRGGKSHDTFTTGEDLVEYIESGKSAEIDTRDAFRHLEIVTVDKDFWRKEVDEKKRKSTVYRERKAKAKTAPDWKKAQLREQEKIKKQNWRLKQKEKEKFQTKAKKAAPKKTPPKRVKSNGDRT